MQIKMILNLWGEGSVGGAFLEKHCEEKGLALSDMADKIVEAVNKCDGYCPCKINPRVLCPCPEHEEDVKEKGRCCCNLFVQKK